MEAGKRTIRDIFNRGRNLEIPFFQRSYVWDTEQWERFLEDMRMISQFRKTYFLGSVILKQQETNSDQDSKLTIIDGQQRLTTLNIFLKVLCLKRGSDNDFEETFKKQRDKSIILLHNHNNEKSFNEIINLKNLIEFPENTNDRIIEAYNFFKININEADLNGNIDFYNILDNILFVGIDLGYEEDEQQIFDTINSLGVKLTTAELLKNYFFNRNELNKYHELWGNVFEKDDETKKYWDNEITAGRLKRNFIDLFFYSYLQIKIQEPKLRVKTEDKIEYSKVETLFESYKKFIKTYRIDKNLLLGEIKDYALVFKKYFDYDVIEEELTNEFGIERINAIIFGLETTTLIPYVLYILKNVTDENQKNQLFELIESYLMRRMVVHATTKNYNQLFTDSLISNEVITFEQFKTYIEKRSDKVNFFPSNSDLENGFENTVLINKQSAGVLYFLESKIRDRSKQATQLLGISKYSLEHLMPKKWENNWGKLNAKTEIDLRNKKLLTLGNLAIITQSLNASIRDSDWETKKNGKGNKQGLVHFSAGIETLAPYLRIDDWNEKEIEKRADFLYKKALEIWKI
jgi:uncharacterized protein with ParB-like and HNH nuclease domain